MIAGQTGVSAALLAYLVIRRQDVYDCSRLGVSKSSPSSERLPVIRTAHDAEHGEMQHPEIEMAEVSPRTASEGGIRKEAVAEDFSPRLHK